LAQYIQSRAAIRHDGAPLGHGGGAPSFVDFSTDEMTLLIEMVVDHGVN
jgi:hypothetical protein